MTMKVEAHSDTILEKIGSVTAQLIKVGKPFSIHDITALLQQNADQASGSQKESCIKALELITAKMH